MAALAATATAVAGCGDDDPTSTTDARVGVVNYGIDRRELPPVADATVDGIRLEGRGERIVRVRFAISNEEPRTLSLRGMRVAARGPSGTRYEPLVSDGQRNPERMFASARLPRDAVRRTTLAFRIPQRDLSRARLRFNDSVNGVSFDQRLYRPD